MNQFARCFPQLLRRSRLPILVLLSPLAVPSAPGAQLEIDFVHQVAPIFRNHCVECHGEDNAKGGFSLNTRELFLEDAAAIPGRADESEFLHRIASRDPDEQMPPPEKDRLPDEAANLLRAWVNAGMPWEEGFTFALNSYEPPLKPRRPVLPEPIEGRTNPVDRLVDHWLQERNLPFPKLVSDRVFLRRASLDLTGLLPHPDLVDSFLTDSAPDKRSRLVRQLLDDRVAYAEHWLAFWNDLLRNDYTGTGFITGGRKQISAWLYDALATNKPFDQFITELIAPPTDASRGFIDGIRWRGEVSAGQTVEIQFAQNVSQAFLGLNLKCASCHDSFINRWKLDDAYGLAAVYSEKPLPIYRCDTPTGREALAAWLFPELGEVNPKAPQKERLQQLASLMTHPDNGRVARTIVNRLWAKLMGRGLVHPLDAMQTEPWHEDLLDFLGVYLVDQDYDLKAVLELIATSAAYQSQAAPASEGTEAGTYTYSGPQPRRLTAEQFLDAVWQLTGASPDGFDAPVLRGAPNPADLENVDLRGRWIWGESASHGEPAFAGETILLATTFILDQPVVAGGAVVTCDNEFTLFINGEESLHGNDWAKPQSLDLRNRLKEGENQIVLRAHNAGDTPNPAGLYFEARLRLQDDSEIRLASGSDWTWSRDLPEIREGSLPLLTTCWQPVTIVPPVSSWSSALQPAKKLLAIVSNEPLPMVRASLMNNDFLMRSLGRPLREQIVSSRPNQITTMEAVDLFNSQILTDYFAQGAKRLLAQDWPDTKALVRHVFQFALTRPPTQAELQVVNGLLGTDPSPEGVQDLLWAVCVTPEFMIIR